MPQETISRVEGSKCRVRSFRSGGRKGRRGFLGFRLRVFRFKGSLRLSGVFRARSVASQKKK